MTDSNEKTRPHRQFTYHRGTDGCDETWDICYPDGSLLVSIHFWERAAETEAEAQLIVHRLNHHERLLAALDGLLAVFDEEIASGVMWRDRRIAKARRAYASAAKPIHQR